MPIVVLMRLLSNWGARGSECRTTYELLHTYERGDAAVPFSGLPEIPPMVV